MEKDNKCCTTFFYYYYSLQNVLHSGLSAKILGKIHIRINRLLHITERNLKDNRNSFEIHIF